MLILLLVREVFNWFMSNSHKKISVSTLGCKVNQYDSAAMAEEFEKQGWEVVNGVKWADIYIINTCVVTASTEAQSRQLIRRTLKTNPDAKIIVTGCYVHSNPEQLSAISRSVHLLGNSDKKDIIDFISSLRLKGSYHNRVSDIQKTSSFNTPPANRLFDRTRAFLKIQDGCNNRCSYCIVPHVRGRSRSLALSEVLRRAAELARNGYREIVLTGVHIGAYGLDLQPSYSILKLIKALEQDNHLNDVRIRLSSIEPNELTDELIDFFAESDKVCPHFHIPLQSGDSHILKMMNRKYGPRLFLDRIERIKTNIKDVNIGIDVIAGFPGETEVHFSNTVEFIEKIEPGYLHVFPYSVRPGTPASNFKNHIPDHEKKRRAGVLRNISDRKKREFYSSVINKKLNVIAEGVDAEDQGFIKGFSENYIPVSFKGTESMIGSQVSVRIIEVEEYIVKGVVG